MRRRPTIAVVLATASLLGACGGGSSSSSDSDVNVAAAFYPLAEVAGRVGANRAGVFDLTPPGTEPHDVELTSNQLDTIVDADVVVYLGRHFQPAVAEAVDRAKGVVKVDVLPDNPTDPHVWLDPVRMVAIVEQVTAGLVTADPAGEADYRRHAATYVEELRALDAEYRAGLAGCARRRIVTAHEAFGHLAARYGLEQSAVTGVSPESEPDPKHLAELADQVKADGTTTIFTESLVSPKVAEALAKEAGVKTAVLNPIEGLTRAQLRAGATYASEMRANLATLRAALACP